MHWQNDLKLRLRRSVVIKYQHKIGSLLLNAACLFVFSIRSYLLLLVLLCCHLTAGYLNIRGSSTASRVEPTMAISMTYTNTLNHFLCCMCNSFIMNMEC